MKAGGMMVSAIIIIDAFFVSYYFGLHSRTVDVEDPSIKPAQVQVIKPAAAVDKDAKTDLKTTGKSAGKHESKTAKDDSTKDKSKHKSTKGGKHKKVKPQT